VILENSTTKALRGDGTAPFTPQNCKETKEEVTATAVLLPFRLKAVILLMEASHEHPSANRPYPG
jgi:hypothetical protein